MRHAPDSGLLRVRENGDLETKGTSLAGSMTFDIAEYFPAEGNLDVGDVVVAIEHATMPGAVAKSARALDRAVVGIVTDKPGIVLGGGFSDELFFPERVEAARAAEAAGDAATATQLRSEIEQDLAKLPRAAIALRGRVKVKVSGENGPIQVGDRLTTSSLPGHAARLIPGTDGRGLVVGKALESFSGEAGTVLVLVGVN